MHMLKSNDTHIVIYARRTIQNFMRKIIDQLAGGVFQIIKF